MPPLTSTDTVNALIDKIHKRAALLGRIRLMEVCGTHTMEIGRLGLRSLLPDNVELVSGPGCPVCVTPANIIDIACSLSHIEKHTILTFGDMIRVPGNVSSLESSISKGGKIQTLLTPLQSIALAKDNPSETFIFISVGFETTIPVIAQTIILADELNIDNLLFLTAHRTVPLAIAALVADKELQIDGFILPGHVCSITGIDPFQQVLRSFLPAAVTGFEPLDILMSIATVIEMLLSKEYNTVNMYRRVVKNEGNIVAQALIKRIFDPTNGVWRGLGIIPGTGLQLNSNYSKFDAKKRFRIPEDTDSMPDGCSCGSVLKGKIKPSDCPLFETICTPESPQGPCMVSSEGSCAAYYKYGGR